MGVTTLAAGNRADLPTRRPQTLVSLYSLDNGKPRTLAPLIGDDFWFPSMNQAGDLYGWTATAAVFCEDDVKEIYGQWLTLVNERSPQILYFERSVGTEAWTSVQTDPCVRNREGGPYEFDPYVSAAKINLKATSSAYTVVYVTLVSGAPDVMAVVRKDTTTRFINLSRN